MHPSEGFRLFSNQHSDIAFTLTQRSIWKDEWGDDKTFFDYTPLLKNYLSERMGARKDMSISEINLEKNLALDQQICRERSKFCVSRIG